MAGFADLVLDASATTGGRLGDAPMSETEGVTWRWLWDEIVDRAGDPVDLTSATIVCKIVTDIDGADVLTLSSEGGVGTLTISATSAQTAGLATGAKRNQGRRCWWYCTVTSGSNKVQFWGPSGSPFLIQAA